MISLIQERYVQLLINEELLATFPSEGGDDPAALPTDALSLLRLPNLNMGDFVRGIMHEYSTDLEERQIRNIVDRFPSVRERQRAEPDTTMMTNYLSKFTMVLNTTPTIKSKYL